MAYDSYQYDKPDVTVEDGLEVGDSTRKNFLAIRDAAIMGLLTGWQIDTTDSNADGNPEVVTFSNQGDASSGDSDEVVRMTITWNADGSPATVKFEYSSTPGTWIAIGTPVAPLGLLTLTYNADGSVDQGVWT